MFDQTEKQDRNMRLKVGLRHLLHFISEEVTLLSSKVQNLTQIRTTFTLLPIERSYLGIIQG